MSIFRASIAAASLLAAAAPLHAQPREALVELINAYRSTSATCEGRRSAPVAPLAAPAALARIRVDSGTLLDVALERAGYPVRQADAISLSGSSDSATVMAMLEQRYCKTLRSSAFSAIGVTRSGDSWLIVLAQPAPPPPASLLPSQDVAGQAILAAVNVARASGRQCGVRFFPASAALAWNASLAQAARVHSADMAAQHYLNHQGKDGRSVAERALAAGYRWRRIGENIAAGQGTSAEAVDGWLASPGHCANLMSEDFKEMGAAYGVSTGRIYWTQVFGTPR